jgi:hypothetical protein
MDIDIGHVLDNPFVIVAVPHPVGGVVLLGSGWQVWPYSRLRRERYFIRSLVVFLDW